MDYEQFMVDMSFRSDKPLNL